MQGRRPQYSSPRYKSPPFIVFLLKCRPVVAQCIERLKHFNSGVKSFALDDKYLAMPTEFNLKFFVGGERYWYQLVLTKSKVHSENLYVYTSRQPSYIFKRDSEGIEFNQSIETIGPVALE